MKTEAYRGETLINRSGRWDGWHVSINGYTRWGTLAEVKADVDHAKLYGHLPAGKAYLWA